MRWLPKRVTRRFRIARESARARYEELFPKRIVARSLAVDGVAPEPSAFAAFGSGSTLAPTAQMTNPQRIGVGRDVVVGDHTSVVVGPATASDGPLLVLGDDVRVGRYVSIVATHSVVIGTGTVVGDFAIITDSWGLPDMIVRDRLPEPDPEPIVIGAGARIGVGAVVGPGAFVGDGAVLYPGAVLTSALAPGAVAVGSPAGVA